MALLRRSSAARHSPDDAPWAWCTTAVGHVQAVVTGQRGAQIEVDVLPREEELLVEEADVVKQRAPVERGARACAEDDARLVEARAVGLADAAVVATAAAHVEAVAGGVDAALAREQHARGREREAGVALERVDQRRQPPRLGHRVVVEQCDVGAVGDRDAVIDGGGEAVVGRQRVPLGAVRLGDRARAVHRSAVDDEHPRRSERLGRDALQAGAEQGFAIEVRDDEIDRGAHAAIMPCPSGAVERAAADGRRARARSRRTATGRGTRRAPRAAGTPTTCSAPASSWHVQPDDLGAIVPEQPHGGGVFAAAVEFLKHGFGDGRACHGTHARAQPAPRSAVLHIRRRAVQRSRPTARRRRARPRAGEAHPDAREHLSPSPRCHPDLQRSRDAAPARRDVRARRARHRRARRRRRLARRHRRTRRPHGRDPAVAARPAPSRQGRPRQRLSGRLRVGARARLRRDRPARRRPLAPAVDPARDARRARGAAPISCSARATRRAAAATAGRSTAASPAASAAPLSAHALGLPYTDLSGGLKFWRASALDTIDVASTRSQGYVFQVETTQRAHRAGLRIVEVPFTFRDRTAGQSKMGASIALEGVRMVARLRRDGWKPQRVASAVRTGA